MMMKSKPKFAPKLGRTWFLEPDDPFFSAQVLMNFSSHRFCDTFLVFSSRTVCHAGVNTARDYRVFVYFLIYLSCFRVKYLYFIVFDSICVGFRVWSEFLYAFPGHVLRAFNNVRLRQ